MPTKQNKKSEARRNTKQPGRGRLLRGVVTVVVLAALGTLGTFGWQWLSTLPCQRIELAGLQRADSTALMELARVDTSMLLIDIDPAMVADRVRRHPWVRTASATRFPTGTLRITVQEQVPVVLVLDRRGRPAHYLDRAGFAMPLADGALYDVPLLRGLTERYHPVRRLQDERVRDLLALFAGLDAETDALVSELELTSSGVHLYTTPVGGRGSLEVQLGRAGFAEKLKRLRAFWHQAVLPQPDKPFHVIDLRFDGQIVTRDASE